MTPEHERIFVVEDEPTQALKLQFILQQSGYRVEVATNGAHALTMLQGEPPTLVISDIMMPEMNGYEVLYQLRSNVSTRLTPFIFLTARTERRDMRQGMNLGADDYLTKPFHLSELAARIKAIYRRRNLGGNTVIRYNEIEVFVLKRIVNVNGSPLTLTKKEYELLVYFLSNKERVLTRESIVEHLWGNEVIMADTFDFLYTHIKNLRKKIMEKGGSDYIKTVYGVGYRFTEQQ